MSEAKLKYNILRLPSKATYRAQRAAPADLYTHPSSPATNAETTTTNYSYDLSTTDRWMNPTQLAHISEFYSFRASMKLSDVCTWEISKRFPNSEWRQAVSLLQAAQQPGAFSVWHISIPEEGDVYDEFLGGSGFGNLIEFDEREPSLRATASDPGSVAPSWVYRGGGGLIQDATIMLTPDGEWEVRIKSACWGKALQETITRVDTDADVDKTDLQAVLWNLFARNADYEPAFLRDLEEDETREDRIASVEGLGGSIREFGGLPIELHSMAIDGDYRAVSPVGKWLIVPLLSDNARTQTDGDHRWETNHGNHTMLKEIQRLAETSGLVFSTSLPYIIFFPPSPRGDIYWDFGGWFPGYQFSFRHLKPRATAWLGTHTDALGGGRSLSVHITDDALVDDYGEIQTSFLSTAPILLSDEAAPYESGADETLEGVQAEPSGDGNDWRLSDYATIRHMAEQVHAKAIYERENWSATVEMPWLPTTRFGIDWYLGDTIIPSINNHRLLPSASSLIVRSADLAIRADGEIRCVAGLGSRANINPRWADQFLNDVPHNVNSRSASSSSVRDGWQSRTSGRRHSSGS